MSQPIGEGDWVGRVRGGAIPKGSIWRVTGLQTCVFGCEECGEHAGIHIADDPAFDGDPWCPCGFRPLPRSSHIEQLIEKLKEPTKGPESV